ncbi:antigen 5 like allergen Cul n 1-like [Anopheles nili]|uniref:antigen 5 like allergen Cul n 1-like n=1 Tax=Anopheles nili TaxID=185578 RepID=UPI00237A3663|nr:antigen 5 like allergen Cul n 1-like [Anopheles nili]
MAFWIFVTIACSLFGGLQAQTNYCTTSYCMAGKTNVGCNPPGTPGGVGCTGKSPAVINLNSTYQNTILLEHNKRRSQFALGQLKPFLPAKRMPTLQWDTELAKQAGNNARNCTFKHDQCRNTAVYASAGQNLAMSQFYGMTKTIDALIKEGITGWWNEYNYTTQADLDKYPSAHTGPAIGHFTQMVSDQSNRIGCAMQYWLDGGKWQTYYLVCDYAVTNIIDRAVYKNGTVASGCTTGRNPDPALNGLCSTAETVKPVPNSV